MLLLKHGRFKPLRRRSRSASRPLIGTIIHIGNPRLLAVDGDARRSDVPDILLARILLRLYWFHQVVEAAVRVPTVVGIKARCRHAMHLHHVIHSGPDIKSTQRIDDSSLVSFGGLATLRAGMRSKHPEQHQSWYDPPYEHRLLHCFEFSRKSSTGSPPPPRQKPALCGLSATRVP